MHRAYSAMCGSSWCGCCSSHILRARREHANFLDAHQAEGHHMLQSSLSWLDYSEHERRQMLDVIDLFKEHTTRDELGIGSIRDGFAEMLFPGTSTVQTRARYFLFIPWMYQHLERKGVNPESITNKARQQEIQLIYALANSADTEGVIGIDVREGLQRLPSSIYWQGLETWGIRLFQGSQELYHRMFATFHRQSIKREQWRDDDNDMPVGASAVSWHPELPEAPADFPSQAAFQLRPVDAEYLRERICTQHHGTLLALLSEQPRASTKVDFP